MTNGQLQNGAARATDLLLEAAGVAELQESDQRLTRLLEKGIDNDQFLELALKHRIVPLLHTRLKNVEDTATLDPVLIDQLSWWSRRFQIDNLAHAQELAGILETLAAEDISVTPYKGPLLALDLYGDLGQRVFYDLDLLIKKPDLPRVHELMLARGYDLADDQGEGTVEKQIETDCELHYLRRSDGILIEMHWDVLPSRYRRGFEIEEYWSRLIPGEIFGCDVQVLGPEDLMIVLCIHGGEKHRWSRIQMLADIGRILNQTELDWDTLLARAADLGRTDTLLLGLYLAWILLAAPLPERVLEMAATPRVRTQAALTFGRLTRADGGLPSYRGWLSCLERMDERARARDRDPGGALGRRHYLAGILTPEWVDHQALPLPRALAWGYYLYRPLRLLRKHRAGLLRRL